MRKEPLSGKIGKIYRCIVLAIIDIKTENIKINFKQKNNNKTGRRSRQAEDWTKYKKNIVKPREKKLE